MTRAVSLCVAIAALLFSGVSAAARTTQSYSSSRALLLTKAALPKGYTQGRVRVVYAVTDWDGGIKPLVTIDERNGWLEAAQETVHDAHRHAVDLSVQIFRDNRGARADFAQFFTNTHPFTIYEPGVEWLGGTSIRGIGTQATLYRTRDASSRCSHHLSSGLTFVYRSAIFSTAACALPNGDAQVRELAKRSLRLAERTALQ